jgi:hypothetical protein
MHDLMTRPDEQEVDMTGESSAEAERTVETLRAKIEYLRQEAGERRERFEALEEEQLLSKISEERG